MDQGTSLKEVWTAKLVLAVAIVAAAVACILAGVTEAGLNLISLATGLVAGAGVTTALVKNDQRRGNTPDDPQSLVS